DPLQQLFEHHLLNRSYDDAGAFSKEVAKEYLGYIDATLAHVPIHLRTSVMEDLETEAHEMLIKKMYGIDNASDSTNFGKVIGLEPKRKSLKPIQFFPPPKADTDSNPDNNEER
ncbi:MAG: hypothetical protein ACKN9V_03560, partial [Pseudomonadota bacterium]